jgi:plasmid stabilization system protein ParE
VRVRFTPSGRLQFLTALAYLQGENPEAARKVRMKVEKVLRRLARFPSSGRLIPEFPDLPYREIVVPPYRLFYRVDRKIVWVVAVWHGAQLPDEPTIK